METVSKFKKKEGNYFVTIVKLVLLQVFFTEDNSQNLTFFLCIMKLCVIKQKKQNPFKKTKCFI